MHDEVVAAVAGAPRAVAAAGAAERVEVAAAEEAAAVPAVPTIVATAAVADLLAAAGDTTRGATSGKSALRGKAAPSLSVRGARALASRRAHTHGTRRSWRWS